MAKVLSEVKITRAESNIKLGKTKNLEPIREDDDPFLMQLDNMALPDAYKQRILQQSKELLPRSNESDCENMVTDLLDGDSQPSQDEEWNETKDIMRRIEEEC